MFEKGKIKFVMFGDQDGFMKLNREAVNFSMHELRLYLSKEVMKRRKVKITSDILS